MSILFLQLFLIFIILNVVKSLPPSYDDHGDVSNFWLTNSPKKNTMSSILSNRESGSSSSGSSSSNKPPAQQLPPEVFSRSKTAKERNSKIAQKLAFERRGGSSGGYFDPTLSNKGRSRTKKEP